MKSHQGTISRTHLNKGAGHQDGRDQGRQNQEGGERVTLPFRFSIAMTGLMMLGIAMGEGLEQVGVDAATSGVQGVMVFGLLLSAVVWLWAGWRSLPWITPVAMIVTMIVLGVVLQSTINRGHEISVAPQ